MFFTSHFAINLLLPHALSYHPRDRFALDVHQRFLLLFGTIVMHVPRQHYEDVLSEARTSCGVAQNQQLDVSALQAVVRKFKALAEVGSDSSLPTHY